MTPIWGHRGCRGMHNPPENSLAAFAEAIRQGADGFELDVHLTKDGHLVVFHDSTLDAHSNGTGPLNDHTLADIKTLRLKQNWPDSLSNECIPTLEEVLQLADLQVRGARPFTVNIEIKQKGIVAEVAQAIRTWQAKGWKRENLLISSFYMPDLRKMREVLPDVAIGALFEGPGPSWNIDETLLAHKLAETADLRPDTVNITMPSITAGTVALIQKTGATVVAWPSYEPNPDTLSKPERSALAALYLDHNVTLITDYPAEMRAMLDGK